MAQLLEALAVWSPRRTARVVDLGSRGEGPASGGAATSSRRPGRPSSCSVPCSRAAASRTWRCREATTSVSVDQLPHRRTERHGSDVPQRRHVDPCDHRTSRSAPRDADHAGLPEPHRDGQLDDGVRAGQGPIRHRQRRARAEVEDLAKQLIAMGRRSRAWVPRGSTSRASPRCTRRTTRSSPTACLGDVPGRGLISAGDVRVTDARADHMEMLLRKIEEMAARSTKAARASPCAAAGLRRATSRRCPIRRGDRLQALITTMLSVADGDSSSPRISSPDDSATSRSWCVSERASPPRAITR